MLNFRRALNGDLLSMEKKTEDDVSLSNVCVPFVVITRELTRGEEEAEWGMGGAACNELHPVRKGDLEPSPWPHCSLSFLLSLGASQ